MGRLKKKYESDVREYEIQVETLNRNNAELSKANKSLAARVKVLHVQGGPKKWHPWLILFDNFDKSTQILTILSLLQQEIHGA